MSDTPKERLTFKELESICSICGYTRGSHGASDWRCPTSTKSATYFKSTDGDDTPKPSDELENLSPAMKMLKLMQIICDLESKLGVAIEALDKIASKEFHAGDTNLYVVAREALEKLK